MTRPIRNIIFDLGGVLVDWDPRYLYREHFPDAASLERFLNEVCCTEWIREMDAGKSFAQAIAERTQRFPEAASALALWGSHWEHTLRGPIEDSVRILQALKERPYGLYALTNWSAETFPIARRRFEFLMLFEDILVSGEHGLLKPDAAIFQLACRRWQVRPDESLFIDDSEANVLGAQALGFHAIHFRSPARLREGLSALGVPA